MKNFLAIVFVFSLFSCSREKPVDPNSLISKQDYQKCEALAAEEKKTMELSTATFSEEDIAKKVQETLSQCLEKRGYSTSKLPSENGDR